LGWVYEEIGRAIGIEPPAPSSTSSTKPTKEIELGFEAAMNQRAHGLDNQCGSLSGGPINAPG